MLLLFTYRSGYRPPWIERSYATQITLPRLTDGECRQVMDAVLHDSRLPEDLVQTVLDKAEGNPFFVEELTRSLLEHPEVAVPDSVLLARIDRLPEEPKRLLQTASVLGREFSAALLSEVWEKPETAGALLADLQRWEFLYEEPTAEEPAERSACRLGLRNGYRWCAWRTRYGSEGRNWRNA